MVHSIFTNKISQKIVKKSPLKGPDFARAWIARSGELKRRHRQLDVSGVDCDYDCIRRGLILLIGSSGEKCKKKKPYTGFCECRIQAVGK